MPIVPYLATVVTASGHQCQVTGDPDAVWRVVALLEEQGFTWNAALAAYDEGYDAADWGEDL